MYILLWADITLTCDDWTLDPTTDPTSDTTNPSNAPTLDPTTVPSSSPTSCIGTYTYLLFVLWKRVRKCLFIFFGKDYFVDFVSNGGINEYIHGDPIVDINESMARMKNTTYFITNSSSNYLAKDIICKETDTKSMQWTSILFTLSNITLRDTVKWLLNKY